MRLFVAVVPPDEVLDDLEEHLEPRRDAGADVRWTDRHQWHVTLAFLGDVAERRLDDLTEALTRSAAKRSPLVLRLAGAGAFPNPYAARVLWAGVEQVRGDLTTSHAAYAPRRARWGRHPTAPASTPTSRWGASPGRRRRPGGSARSMPFEGPAWVADHVTLVESHLGEGRGRRPRYEVVAELPLGR